jgi:hypothetical protein
MSGGLWKAHLQQHDGVEFVGREDFDIKVKAYSDFGGKLVAKANAFSAICSSKCQKRTRIQKTDCC